MNDMSLAVLLTPESEQEQVFLLAESLQLPWIEHTLPKYIADYEAVLWYSPAGLVVQQTGKGAPGPVLVDFVGGAVGHRRKFGGGKGQEIAKAVGVADAGRPLKVLDATAGLGRDAFVLASLGCEVTLMERSPLVVALLADGLERACHDPDVALIAQRMTLCSGDSLFSLSDLVQQGRSWDVIYLDPMFPHREKSAQVKKEMKIFQSLIGPDLDADGLLAPALALAKHRVVIKRPRLAPDLDDQEPTYRRLGKSGRFDIHAIASFKER